MAQINGTESIGNILQTSVLLQHQRVHLYSNLEIQNRYFRSVNILYLHEAVFQMNDDQEKAEYEGDKTL